MDIDRSEHYNLLVDKIKAKLIWWNARKLSFAGKIVIANQVNGHNMAYSSMLDNRAQVDESD